MPFWDKNCYTFNDPIDNFSYKINIFPCSLYGQSSIVINLGERDGDALLQKIKNQLENKEPINELELIYLPLYHSKCKNVPEMLKQVIELAPLISESNESKEKIMIMSAVLVNRFIDEKDSKKIWEMINMYVEDLFIIKFAKEEAKEEGKEEVIISMLKNGLDVETIAKYTEISLSELEKIKKNLVNS